MAQETLRLHARRVVTPDGIHPAVVTIERGRITAVDLRPDAAKQAGALDLAGLVLMPGIVDPHSHNLNQEPELSAEEGQTLALQNGITALGNLFTDQANLRTIRRLEARGELRVRTTIYLSRHNSCGEDFGEWYTFFPPVNS